jgi:hypothetical protein
MKSTSSFGAYGELFACNYFINLGLEVFRNISPVGPVDIVVLNTETGKSILVDVKATRSVYVKADGTQTFPIGPKLREDNVWQILYVHGEAAVRLPVGFWEALGMETAE